MDDQSRVVFLEMERALSGKLHRLRISHQGLASSDKARDFVPSQCASQSSFSLYFNICLPVILLICVS